ncbi:hypothetical protein ACJRO7_007793 [Eucalyptus globulus]|uniref:Retrotransposon gag domain-containing protein n=1 Tax=Eucalyptus globulus TaxID=34317 RepID=A0ABD3IPE6_EUCGL
MVRYGSHHPSRVEASAARAKPQMEDILQALANIGNLMERQAQQQPGAERRTQGLFSGMGSPEEAEHWIDGMERIFRLLDCNDVEKITLAEYQLERNAKFWWRASKDIIFPPGTDVNWEEFVRAFNRKHFSDCAKDKKISEFVQLEQRELTVDQYEARFSELSRYAHRLIEDQEEKAKRFLKGLRTNIRKQLVPLNIRDYHEIYERAQLVEQELMRERSEFKKQLNFNDVRRGKRPYSSQGQTWSVKKKSNFGNLGEQEMV